MHPLDNCPLAQYLANKPRRFIGRGRAGCGHPNAKRRLVKFSKLSKEQFANRWRWPGTKTKYRIQAKVRKAA